MGEGKKEQNTRIIMQGMEIVINSSFWFCSFSKSLKMNAGKHILIRCTLIGQHSMEVKSMDSRASLSGFTT